MSADTNSNEGLTESIYGDAIAWFDEAIARVDELISPAQLAAQKLLEGGKMYVLGSHGLVCELMGRAGGLAGLQPWTDQRLTEKDVVLAGQLLPDDMGGRIGELAAVARGDTRLTPTLTFYIAGGSWLFTSRLMPSFGRHWRQFVLLDTHAPAKRSFRALAVAQMAGIATAWALVGEIYSAVARAGRALATYGSLLEDGGKEWLDKYRGKMFNDDISVAPAPAGEFARTYLATCREQLRAFDAAQEGRQVRLGAQRLAGALAAGRMALVLVSGHVLAEDYLIPPSLERMVLFGRDYEWRRPCMLEGGDFLVYMGYLDYPREKVDIAMSMGADVITFTAEANGPTNDRQTHIDGHWKRWDSVVSVKGSPYKILPASGVIQTPQWLSFIAELAARLDVPARGASGS